MSLQDREGFRHSVWKGNLMLCTGHNEARLLVRVTFLRAGKMPEDFSWPIASRTSAALAEVSDKPMPAPVKKCTGSDSSKMPSM